MKSKFSDLLLILAAIGVVSSVGYNFFRAQSASKATALQEVVIDRESITKRNEIPFSDDADELREQLRNADKEEVLRYMRQIVARKLPDDYRYPDFLLEAGTGKESARVIGERYPEFYKLGGSELINAVKQYPVKYQNMMQESLAYRQLYNQRKAEVVRDTQATEKAADK